MKTFDFNTNVLNYEDALNNIPFFDKFTSLFDYLLTNEDETDETDESQYFERIDSLMFESLRDSSLFIDGNEIPFFQIEGFTVYSDTNYTYKHNFYVAILSGTYEVSHTPTNVYICLLDGLTYRSQIIYFKVSETEIIKNER